MTTTVSRLITSRRSRPALATWLAGAALTAFVLIGATPRVVAAQEPAHAAAAPAEEHADAAHGEEAHDPGWKPTIAKTFNFALLVGVLVYFLRTPLAGHLMTRGTQVRADLDAAAAPEGVGVGADRRNRGASQVAPRGARGAPGARRRRNQGGGTAHPRGGRRRTRAAPVAGRARHRPAPADGAAHAGAARRRPGGQHCRPASSAADHRR